MENKYSVVIIGAGSIGALKPYNIDSPKTKNILTHAHAVMNNKNLELVGIIDVDEMKRDWAAEKWGVSAYDSIDTLLELSNKPAVKDGIDIFVVASPTFTHHHVIKEIIEKTKPKLIICEKPFCSSLEKSEKVFSDAFELEIPIAVNYLRRYSKAIQELRERLLSGFYGKIISASIVYTRGLIRDGSHAVDICRYFFGEFLQGIILNETDEEINDFSDEDLTYPVFLSYRNCKNIMFIPFDGRAYSVFDMEIYTEEGKITLTEHFETIKFYPKEKEKIYGNFQSLSYKCKTKETANLKNSLVELYNNCIEYLESRVPLICNGADGLEVHQIFKELFEKL